MLCRLHIGMHLLGLLCELAIAAATIASWVRSGTDSTGLGGSAKSSKSSHLYTFLMLSLLCTAFSFAMSLNSIRRARRHALATMIKVHPTVPPDLEGARLPDSDAQQPSKECRLTADSVVSRRSTEPAACAASESR